MAYNDVTGDEIKSRVVSDKYRDNWDRIFNKRKDDEQKDTGDTVSNTDDQPDVS